MPRRRRSPAEVTTPQQGPSVDHNINSVMVQRRRGAARRLPALDGGHSDPLDALAGLPIEARPCCCPGGVRRRRQMAVMLRTAAGVNRGRAERAVAESSLPWPETLTMMMLLRRAHNDTLTVPDWRTRHRRSSRPRFG